MMLFSVFIMTLAAIFKKFHKSFLPFTFCLCCHLVLYQFGSDESIVCVIKKKIDFLPKKNDFFTNKNRQFAIIITDFYFSGQ
jgi:hypothetical protein